VSTQIHDIALADAVAFRHRARLTKLIALAFVGLLLGLVGFAFSLINSKDPQHGALLPAGKRPVVVLDVSASITGAASRRVLDTLQTLANAGGTAGLIVFSDAAYQMLPPSAPASELRSLFRFFVPIAGSNGGPSFSPSNPWTSSFSSGTQIAVGIDAARRALQQAHVHNGSIVLVSDLADGEDPAILASAISRLRASKIPLRIVPLFPARRDALLFEQLLGNTSFATAPEPSPGSSGSNGHPFRTPMPRSFLLVAAALVLILAAYQLWVTPLTFRTAERDDL
jgi:hypothetical protein